MVRRVAAVAPERFGKTQLGRYFLGVLQNTNETRERQVDTATKNRADQLKAQWQREKAIIGDIQKAKGEIEAAIAAELPHDHRTVVTFGGEVARRLERAVAVAQEHARES